MNRRHTAAQYLDILNRVRERRPDVAISGDFIVGFPGETENDFQETFSLCQKVQYAQAYSFKYSARPGTPAAELDEINEDIKSDRLLRLQKLLVEQQRIFQKSMIGKTYPVLIEKLGKEPGQVVGRSPYLQPVFLEGAATLLGKILSVTIKSYRANSLEGKVA